VLKWGSQRELEGSGRTEIHLVYRNQMGSINEELERLAALRRSGDLTDAEYDSLKAQLLEGVVPKDSDAGQSPVEATLVGPFCRTCGKPVAGTAAICLNCGTNQRSSSHLPSETAITAPEPKSVGIAVLLTVLWPGAGHLYLGNSKKAIPFVIANAIGVGLAVFTLLILFPITFIIWLVTLIMTAPSLSKETAEYNSNLL